MIVVGYSLQEPLVLADFPHWLDYCSDGHCREDAVYRRSQRKDIPILVVFDAKSESRTEDK